MAEATVAPGSTSAADLRIVLFGLKSAGKSSLLGALAQAAQTQEKYLKGQIIDRSDGRLSALHQRLFEDAPEQTEEDIILYPLQFKPLTPTGPGPARNIVIYDCNGTSASEILLTQQFEGRARRTALVRALVDADTVLLVVDASDKPQQLERDFGQFASFLRIFEESRARHSEVAGLPVYLVLTKCDLLAQQGDTAGAWIQRIEDKKRQVAQRFQKFLSKQADLSFGKINLNLWATAIHRPGLADRPAKSVEPFGVADLFRQCLQSAINYSTVRKQAQRRLQVTLLSVAALVMVMVALGLAFYLGRPPEGMEQLRRQFEMYLPSKDAEIGDRLDAKDAARNARKLKELMSDPKFVEVDRELKKRVSTYVSEYEAYDTLKERFKGVRMPPNLISTAAELKKTQKELEAFTVPPQFAKANLAQMRASLETDLNALSSAVAKEQAWYEQQLDAGKPLYDVNIGVLRNDAAKRKEWLAKVNDFVAHVPPYPNDEKVVPGAQTVRNETVYNFETVVSARNELDNFKQMLIDLRKLVEK